MASRQAVRGGVSSPGKWRLSFSCFGYIRENRGVVGKWPPAAGKLRLRKGNRGLRPNNEEERRPVDISFMKQLMLRKSTGGEGDLGMSRMLR
jgi:hypothetical protein